MATYQSVTKGDLIDVSPHVERARRALAASERLVVEGFCEDAVARAHQSTIHAERALLATEKRSPNTIWSVHRLAAQHFLLNDQLDRGHATALEAVAALHAHVDEQPLGQADAGEAEGAVGTARAFLSDVEAWLGEQGFVGAET